MISEFKYFDDFNTSEEQFHLIDLLKLIKKIYYNYTTQDNTLHAIIKTTATLYNTKQRKEETIEDFALSTENRLAVYMALRGTVLNVGVNEQVTHNLYKRKYTTLDATEKKNGDTNSIKRVTSMNIFGNGDKERFGKQ